MSLILGMTASAASAHKHEFSPSYDADMNHPDQHPFTHPLSYLQGRLQAFSTACASAVTPATSAQSAIAHSDGPASDTSTRSSLDASTTTETRAVQALALEPLVMPKPATTKTTYLLSHPASPARKHRIIQRHRMLLQLRRIDVDRSPTPALELFPGSAFPRSMAKRLPQSSKHHHGLHSSDLVILNCESHRFGNLKEEGHSGSSDDEALDLGQREVVGSIHMGDDEAKSSNVELCIGSSTWSVSKFEKGRYEFSGLDDDGNCVVARWFIKSSRRSRRSSNVHGMAEQESDRKFSFSILRKGTRRHPIVGRMDQTMIEVFDQYTIPDSATTSPLASPVTEAFSPLSLGDGNSRSYFSNEYPAPNSIVATSADLKKLTLVTGIWVAIAEGWSIALTSQMDSKTGIPVTSIASNQSSLRLRNNSGKGILTNDLRSQTSQNNLNDHSSTSKASHSSSTAQPESPGPKRSHFPYRSNTISAVKGSIRRRSGLFGGGHDIHSSAEEVSHKSHSSSTSKGQSILAEPFMDSRNNKDLLQGKSKAEERGQSSFTVAEVSRRHQGLVANDTEPVVTARSAKGEKRDKILGIIPRKIRT